MATLHMTEAEVARDLHAVLEKVRQGVEVVIDEGIETIAIMKPTRSVGRSIDEIVKEAEARKLDMTLDGEFGNDMEKVIASHQRPWNPPSWDL